jgi:putative photosynthetic complex assembly protein 2
MFEIGLPMLLAITVWWLSTGVILYLDGLGRGSFRWSMAAATALSVAALVGLAWTGSWQTPAGAYIAFLCALMLWGWNEMAFLMGYLSGPRRTPCPPDAVGFRRFRYAAETLIDHELGILASAAVIAALTWGEPNQFGLWTFAVLWIMRLSTKLNIFLGAPNIPDEFLPAHMRYLSSYFRRRPMNGFFPFAITAATLFTAFLVHMALVFSETSFAQTGYLLLTTLMALAILEHWLLYVPISATKLWSWGLASHRGTGHAQQESGAAADLHADRRAPFRQETSQPDGASPGQIATSVDAGLLTSWSADISRPCDPRELRLVLDAVVGGLFGQVERVDGAARSSDGWLRFAVADGRATLDKIKIFEDRQGRVTAVGRAFDRERLGAAFAACAA